MLYVEEGQEVRQSAIMMAPYDECNALIKQEIPITRRRRKLVDNDEPNQRPPEMTKPRPPLELTFDPKQLVDDNELHHADSTRAQASSCPCDHDSSASRGQAPTRSNGGKNGTKRDDIEFTIEFSPPFCDPNVDAKRNTTKTSTRGGAMAPPAEFKLNFAKEPSQQAGGREPQDPVAGHDAAFLEYDEPEDEGFELVMAAPDSKNLKRRSQQAEQRTAVVHANKRLDISFTNPISDGVADNSKTMREEFVLLTRHKRKGPPRTIVGARGVSSASIMSEVTLSGHFDLKREASHSSLTSTMFEI